MIDIPRYYSFGRPLGTAFLVLLTLGLGPALQVPSTAAQAHAVRPTYLGQVAGTDACIDGVLASPRRAALHSSRQGVLPRVREMSPVTGLSTGRVYQSASVAVTSGAGTSDACPDCGSANRQCRQRLLRMARCVITAMLRIDLKGRGHLT
jgi:hypothetical protein